MDRFRWCNDEIEHYASSIRFADASEESIVLEQLGVRLYDGSNRTSFDNGILKLTTHRILWIDSRSTGNSFIALPLAAVTSMKKDESSSLHIGRTPKLILKLLPQSALQNLLTSLPNPPQWTNQWSSRVLDDHSIGSNFHAAMVVNNSNEDYIKLGFTQSRHHEFERALNELLTVKMWTVSTQPNLKSSARSFGAGIGAIQRQQAARAVVTDVSITETFEDLNQLISRASEMVQLSRNLARKVRDATDSNNLSANQITELRSTMLSMGVMDDNVLEKPNQSMSSNSETAVSFYTQLAQQLSNLIYPLLCGKVVMGKDNNDKLSNRVLASSSCMDLATVYCRINRARGMSLISPDDLIQACSRFEMENLPLRLKSYPGGLLVLQLASEDESETLKATSELVIERSYLTADELARATNLSPLLAKARLLAIEEAGLACRDDSEAGLRFYPNRFTMPVD